MKKSVLIHTLAASLALAAGSARAENLYTASFAGTSGTQPADFTITNAGDGDLALDGTGRYKMTTGTNVISIYNAVAADSFTDYTVSASYVSNSRGSVTPIGLVARYRDATNLYSGRIVSGGSDSAWTLQIYRFGGAGNQQLAVSETFTLEKADDTLYHGRLEFSVIGSGLSLTFYGNEAGTGTPLASITATDATFTQGTAGFRSTNGGTGVLAWTGFSIATPASVPEPATLATLAASLALASAIFIRRRR